jgi:hypothetical protein
MNWDEYNILFHKLNLNRVAFKEVKDCSEEILTLVNAALAAEREWVGLTQTQVKLLREGVEKESIKTGDSIDWVFYTHINEALREKNQ